MPLMISVSLRFVHAFTNFVSKRVPKIDQFFIALNYMLLCSFCEYNLSFLFQDDLTEYEIEDISANRAATLLYVLKTVACSSSTFEKKAIAFLFHDYKEKFLDMKLVGKVSI